jgi:hypothetical protein
MSKLTQIDQNHTDDSTTQDDGHNVAVRTGLKAGHYEHFDHHREYEHRAPIVVRHERFERHPYHRHY